MADGRTKQGWWQRRSRPALAPPAVRTDLPRFLAIPPEWAGKLTPPIAWQDCSDWHSGCLDRDGRNEPPQTALVKFDTKLGCNVLAEDRLGRRWQHPAKRDRIPPAARSDS